jgi:cell division protein FtsA
MQSQAEQLKVKFGSALADEVFDNRIITIPGLKGREPKEISEKNLARIIQARVEEIFDHVFWEIRRSGFERKLMAGGIVLTGGGALLAHIEKLAAYHTGMPTRIGSPIEHLAHGYAQDLSSPIYATALGLILKGLKEMPPAPKEEKVTEETTATAEDRLELESNAELKNGKWYEELFRKTKEWFEAEPETDF